MFACNGILFSPDTSGPFMFPIHDARDNWQLFSDALKILHTKSGFQYLEGDFHVNYGARKGIADPSDPDIPIPIMGSYAFCHKPMASLQDCCVRSQ